MAGKENIVVGIGNLLLCDDALGPLVVRKLAGEKTFPGAEDYEFREGYGWSLDLLVGLTGFKRAVFIDSFESEQHSPGECLEISGTQMESYPSNPVHSHGLNPWDLWALGTRLGLELPGEWLIIGIAVYDTRTFSEELSAPLRPLFNTITTRVAGILGRWITGPLQAGQTRRIEYGKP